MTVSIFFMYLTGHTYFTLVLDTIEKSRVGGVSGFVHLIANLAGIVAPAATGIKAPPERNMRGASETRDMSLPLLNFSDAAVKELIRSAKKRGHVTVDQISAVLPSKEANSEQIKDILSIFGEMGVNMVETKEAEPEEEPATREEQEEEAEGENALVEVQQRPVPAKSGAKDPAGRTDDPVPMYLREMSSVELLSREGEIAIAKRIEAGREAMIAGLCESPLTFQAIIIWRDDLHEGKVFLRDIIDLEATYAGPDAKAMPAPEIGPDGQLIVGIAVPGQPGRPPKMKAPATAPATATPFKPARERTDGDETAADGTFSESNLDDDDVENWLSVGSASSARSCTWCRRASARRAKRRRRWWRQTCASSSRSRRNTPTAACSFST
jgi:RNA polymerase primary sigma factor